MITHKAIEGPFLGGDWSGEYLIGCYEDFDHANEAAIRYARESKWEATATVLTVANKKVVQYTTQKSGERLRLTAESGPGDTASRLALGWDVPDDDTP